MKSFGGYILTLKDVQNPDVRYELMKELKPLAQAALKDFGLPEDTKVEYLFNIPPPWGKNGTAAWKVRLEEDESYTLGE